MVPSGSGSGVAAWGKDVDSANIEDFNQWLIDRDGQIVSIKADINGGEWSETADAGQTPTFYVNPSAGAWDAGHLVQRSLGL